MSALHVCLFLVGLFGYSNLYLFEYWYAFKCPSLVLATDPVLVRQTGTYWPPSQTDRNWPSSRKRTGIQVCACVRACLGSGKSYTMMGSVENPGLIPRLCSALFDRTLKEKREEESFTVEVSYMEIYNERVRDLLDPKGYALSSFQHPETQMQPISDLLTRSAATNIFSLCIECPGCL